MHGDVLGKERLEKAEGAKFKVATPVRPTVVGSFRGAGRRQIGRRRATPARRSHSGPRAL
jgi:hypothetical protein